MLTFSDTVLIYKILRGTNFISSCNSVLDLKSFPAYESILILRKSERRWHDGQLFKRSKMLFDGKKEADGRT